MILNSSVPNLILELNPVDLNSGNSFFESVLALFHFSFTNYCNTWVRSDKFWDQYVQWEMESKNFKNAMKVWDQMIRTPTQAVKKHFEK